MTITTPTTRVVYSGDGASTGFAIPFPFFGNGELDILVVNADGSVVEQELGGTYTIVGGNDATGTATMLTPPAAGTQLLIRRLTNRTQLNEFSANDALPADTLETTLDRLAALATEDLEILNRTVRAPVQEGLLNALPIVPVRANQLLGFDGNGQPTVYAPATAPGIASSALVLVAGGTTLLPLSALLADRIDVRIFGAKLDGVTDDTAAIQAAINYAQSLGGGVIDAGQGTSLISQTIKVTSSGVRIIGHGRGGFHDVNPLATANTIWRWIGLNGGMMVQIQPLTGASQQLMGCDFLDILLVSGLYPYSSAASVGLNYSSASYGRVDIQTMEFTAQAMLMDYVTGLGESQSPNANEITLLFRQINTAGTGLQLSGSGSTNGNNVAFTSFKFIYGNILNGIGIDWQDADNCYADDVVIHQVAASTTGALMYFRGGTAADPTATARANVIKHFSGGVNGGTIYSEGVGDRGGVVTTPALNNQILFYDSENHLPDIRVGSGGNFFWGGNTAPVGMRQVRLDPYNGVKTYASGEIELWMQVTLAGAGAQTFTYPGPTVFPNTAIQALLTNLGTGALTYGVTSLTTSAITITASAAGVFYVRVWGY